MKTFTKACLILLLPSFALANPRVAFRNTYEGFKYSQERTDKFVIACLASFDVHGRNYNHDEIEQMAVDCAERLIAKLDDLDYGDKVAK